MAQKTLKDTTKANPTQLGDPVSLKAESSNTSPTEHDRPNKQTDKSEGKKSLKQLAEANPTQLGDPISLKAETSDTNPTDETRGAVADNATPAPPREKVVKPKL
ncbi:hypothetical protein AAFC00_005387 [Neodothiora populina]|uniref:Uncharacterized protein n=1 Tax=Neodothiora populina TaxID=2781224 RepID=A0ABR3PKR3_9PEZI